MGPAPATKLTYQHGRYAMNHFPVTGDISKQEEVPSGKKHICGAQTGVGGGCPDKGHKDGGDRGESGTEGEVPEAIMMVQRAQAFLPYELQL